MHIIFLTFHAQFKPKTINSKPIQTLSFVLHNKIGIEQKHKFFKLATKKIIQTNNKERQNRSNIEQFELFTLYIQIQLLIRRAFNVLKITSKFLAKPINIEIFALIPPIVFFIFVNHLHFRFGLELIFLFLFN